MSTPPPSGRPEPGPQDAEPPGQGPPGQQPARPGVPSPPGQSPPVPEGGGGCAIAGGIAGGLLLYLAGNFVLFLVAFSAAGQMGNANPVLGGAAALLAILSIGGGALCFKGPYWVKGLGLGLIIGWSLVSIVTLGMCTGLNPELYQGS